MNARIFRGQPPGEVAVIGLGKSGRAVAELLARDGQRVYASDAGTGEGVQLAAAELATRGVAVQLGGHDLARIAQAALVVASPGVPPTAAPLAAARGAGRDPVGEIEIALHFMPGVRYVAVTGTNGKTTTTALIGHLLRALGHDAPAGGNIGIPLAELALRSTAPAWVALELSSFQLHDTPSVNPTVGVLTNLSPDHLDRYVGVDDYYADKALLFRNAHAGSRWVLNADDPRVMAMAHSAAGDRRMFTTHGAPGAAAALAPLPASGRAALWVAPGVPLLPRDELALLGDHNVANALAAALAVYTADTGHQTSDTLIMMADALRSFGALDHRLEPVGTFGGVEWINDSKATNLSSTLVAIEGMTRPFVLLLGGRHKGESYAALAEPFARRGRTILAYGEAAPLIERDLGALVPVERLGSSFEQVIARARALAAPGDAVLLSPACSSYDMFTDYEERGTAFRRLAAGDAR